MPIRGIQFFLNIRLTPKNDRIQTAKPYLRHSRKCSQLQFSCTIFYPFKPFTSHINLLYLYNHVRSLSLRVASTTNIRLRRVIT